MMLPSFPMPLIMGAGGLPEIGQPWEGGFYIGNIIDGGLEWALVVASKSSGQNNSLQWKTAQTTTAGTTSPTNGPANTAAMNNTSHPAAKYCSDLIIGGIDDWYLPATDELQVLLTNDPSLPVGERADADSYWSSSEAASSRAWYWTFPSGSASGIAFKTAALRVRGVRRLAI